MGGGSSYVLGGNLPDLGLFARPPGVNADGSSLARAGGRVGAVAVRPGGPVPADRHARRHRGRPQPAARPWRAHPLPVPGVGPIPASGVTSVIANVTAVDVTAAQLLHRLPRLDHPAVDVEPQRRPGRPVPNLVLMGVGNDGCIEVFNSHGCANCLVDVFGYTTTTAGDRFTSLTPARLFDTRTGEGIRPGKVAGPDAGRRPGRRPPRHPGEWCDRRRDEPDRDRTRIVGVDAGDPDRRDGRDHVERELLARRHRAEPRDLQTRCGWPDHDRRLTARART